MQYQNIISREKLSSYLLFIWDISGSHSKRHLKRPFQKVPKKLIISLWCTIKCSPYLMLTGNLHFFFQIGTSHCFSMTNIIMHLNEKIEEYCQKVKLDDLISSGTTALNSHQIKHGLLYVPSTAISLNKGFLI